MMKKPLSILFFLWAGVAFAQDELASKFQTPPASARPYVFWYWIDGNVTPEGIDADLNAMKRAGIGGVEIYNIGGHGAQGKTKMLSPEWRALMKQAITRAGELGLEVDLNNSPGGWSSSGGPWITPEISMQKLTWSETRVQGGKHDLLPQPAMNEGFYRDVAVLAFPTPKAEQLESPVPSLTSSDPAFKGAVLFDGDESEFRVLSKPPAGQSQFLQLAYERPWLARSLRIVPQKYGMVPKGKLLASDDGQSWREVLAFPKGRNRASLDAVFTPTTARYWRVEFEGQETVSLSELILGPRYRLAEWTGKAIFDHYGLDKPSFTPGTLSAPEDCSIPLDSIVDVSAQMDSTGRLNWRVPPGDWTILRFGHTSTGQNTGPAGPGADGLECDKFDSAALDVHWANGMMPFFQDREIDQHVQYVHVDSYEKGAQNWTGNFPREFKNRCGYDLLRYLPAVTGRVVENLETSERFLWDFRQVCCGLIAEKYFSHMRDLCHRHGKRFTLEPYHQTQFNNVTVGSYADVPMCEFWTGGLPGPYWYKLGASPAHVYGKQLVGAEAFTAPRNAGGNYTTDPWALKVLGDMAFCGGVNRYFCHVYVMQPWLDKAPGMTLAAFGTHFERTNTWFEQMPAFTRYVSRCQYLLSQGRFSADVLYFCGENNPNESLAPEGPTAMPRGYDYDVCDAQAILGKMKVQAGRLVLDSGMSYRILVLPGDEYMTPATLKQIRRLVQDGATVLGPRPMRSPSLGDQPAADDAVRKLAAEIWGDCDGKTVTEHSFGKGRVVWGKSVKDVLTCAGAAADFDAGQVKSPINYIHRHLEDGELYFVANSGDFIQSANCAFRVVGLIPELWDPLTGSVRALPEYRLENARTVVPMRFEARQSFFVVFRKAIAGTEGNWPGGKGVKNFPEIKPRIDLNGPWTVRFDSKWGGPKELVVFDQLEDWSKRPEEGIRYYSGKATYRKVMDLPKSLTLSPAEAGKRTPQIYLDLGTVKNVAEVRFNGKSLGTVWCAPWRVEITGLARETGNELEIDIFNLWPNRLIGDEQLPEDCEWQRSGHGGMQLKKLPQWLLENTPRPSGRYTFSSWKHFTKEDGLLPSGLLGPVRIMKEE